MELKMKNKTILCVIIFMSFAIFVRSQTIVECNEANNGRHFWSGLNCSSYMTCFDGTFHLQNCPSPFWFNFDQQICDWASASTCITVYPSGTQCTAQNQFRHYSTNHNCSSYFTCSDGFFILQNCPGSFWFNLANQSCDLPQNVNCQHAPTTTSSTTTSTTTSRTTTSTTSQPITTPSATTTTTQNPNEIVCPSSGVSRIPNPYSCTRYFLCFDGTPVERVCSPGLYFSRSLLRCVRRNESDCDLETHLCPEVNDPNNIIFLANQEDCQNYFICYDGEPKEMSCGPRLHWDSVNNWCIPIENSTCVPSFVLPEIQEIDCPFDSMFDLLFLPHPVDCRFYFSCFLMESRLQRCQSRTLFDHITGACRLSDVARCYA